MKKLLLAVLLVVVAIVALSLESRLTVFGVRPNVTALLAYYSGLKKGPLKGILFGAFLGMAEDGLSGSVLGPNLLASGAVGFLASYAAEGFLSWTPFLGLLSVFFLTALDGALAFASLAVFTGPPAPLVTAALITLGQAALNSFFGPFVRPCAER
jgi:rod shape-determining protein MreD